MAVSNLSCRVHVYNSIDLPDSDSLSIRPCFVLSHTFPDPPIEHLGLSHPFLSPRSRVQTIGDFPSPGDVVLAPARRRLWGTTQVERGERAVGSGFGHGRGQEREEGRGGAVCEQGSGVGHMVSGWDHGRAKSEIEVELDNDDDDDDDDDDGGTYKAR